MQDYQPLFLKYRPQKLSEVLGQDSVKDTLINAINNNKIVKAYLLTGPRGSGKTSSARILAKSLNCLKPEDGNSPTISPCGTCESCTSIANSNSIDVTEIDAASHGHVDDARKLIEKVNLSSVSGKHRVYIIDEVHMLTNSAFNALLKVIEEPPKNVVFILATTEIDKVPKTISSRCQQLKFKPITIKDCLQRLNYVCAQEGININPEALALIAEHSDGAMRDALSLLDQISVFSEADKQIDASRIYDVLGSIPRKALGELALSIISKDTKASLDTIDEFIAAGKDSLIICREFSNFLFALIESFYLDETDELLADAKAKLQELNIERNYIIQIIDSLNELEFKLKQSLNAKNILRAWTIKACHQEDFTSIKDLKHRVDELEKALKNGGANLAKVSVQVKKNKVEAIPTPSKSNQTSPSPKVEQDPTVNNPTVATSPSLTANTSDSSDSDDFMAHLSPSSKGLLVSSHASLKGIENSQAIFVLPSKFKFLKSRLEQKSNELIDAINKAKSAGINSLNFEITDDAPVSPRLSPVETKTQESQATPSNTSENNAMPANIPAQSSVNSTKLSEVFESAKQLFNGKEL